MHFCRELTHSATSASVDQNQSKVSSGVMWDVTVVGAGAAGLLAAIHAAERGRSVLLLEKNRKAGVKILMSGGTRCNITHATDVRGIVQAYGTPGRFLHSALAALGPQDVVDLFHAEGVPTKVEETGKVFPVSDKALDVQQALLRRLARSNARFQNQTAVTGIRRTEDESFLLECQVESDDSAGTTRSIESTRSVILTTGGRSYPGCGTTGDGYAWATELGHTLILPRPSLVPLVSQAQWVHDLKGITLPDVVVKIVAAGQSKSLAQCRSSLLFTHFGLSGPAALNVSRVVSGQGGAARFVLQCDLLPDWTDERLLVDFDGACRTKGNVTVFSRMVDLLPRRLVETLFTIVGMPPLRKFAEWKRGERLQLVRAVKQLEIPLSGTLGFEKAEVTAGGVALNEVDSRTMQSKLVNNLYFAGEILDLDGPIGGFNFQAAFSTGWLAGANV